MNIAKYIDHTLLNPHAKRVDIAYLCKEAVDYGFRAICINPEWVPEARKQLVKFGDKDRQIKIAQVLNFPTTKCTKVYKESNEVDLFIPFSGIRKSNKHVRRVIATQLDRHLQNIEKDGVARKDIKLIIETRVLTPKEINLVCRMLKRLRIGCIKTSTGLYKRQNNRTNLEDLKLIKKAIRLPNIVSRPFKPLLRMRVSTPWLKVSKFLFKLRGFTIFIPYKLSFHRPNIKVAGGIRSYREARQLVQKGAYILGCSKGIQIVKEQNGKGQVIKTNSK
jgi:deoxyribose-phosphate aldolase